MAAVYTRGWVTPDISRVAGPLRAARAESVAEARSVEYAGPRARSRRRQVMLAPRSQPARGRAAACALLVVLTGGCALELDTPQMRSAEVFVGEGAPSERARLVELRASAEAAPEDSSAQWRAGAAHVRSSLRGHLEQREHAERYLERAWRLDPRGERVPAARVLARFLNLRSSVMDLSKIDLQLELYASVLDGLDARAGASEGEGKASDDEALAAAQFQFDSFARAAQALRRYGEGQTLGALRELGALEREMERLSDRIEELHKIRPI